MRGLSQRNRVFMFPNTWRKKNTFKQNFKENFRKVQLSFQKKVGVFLVRQNSECCLRSPSCYTTLCNRAYASIRTHKNKSVNGLEKKNRNLKAARVISSQTPLACTDFSSFVSVALIKPEKQQMVKALTQVHLTWWVLGPSC